MAVRGLGDFLYWWQSGLVSDLTHLISSTLLFISTVGGGLGGGGGGFENLGL